MVKQALEAHRASKKAAAFQDIADLVDRIEGHKVAERAKIRKIKVELRKVTSALDELDRRWAYAQETNNFVPVLAFFNMVSANDLANPDDFAKLSSVLADWQPTPEVTDAEVTDCGCRHGKHC